MKQFKSYFQSISRVISCIEKLDKESCFHIFFIENQVEYKGWRVIQDKRINKDTLSKCGYLCKQCSNKKIYLTPQGNLFIYFYKKDEIWHIYKFK